MKKNNWFHATGVCGKATANVAKMFKDMGWFVTGSDLQFLPPASKIIEENNILFEQNYSFRNLTKSHWLDKVKPEDWNKTKAFGTPHSDAQQRKSVGAIIFNQTLDKVVALDWYEFGYKGIVQGGVNEGEDILEALSREITEETGFTDFEIITQLGQPVKSFFYADNKKVWRELELEAYLVILKSGSKVDLRLDETEHFNLEWLSIDAFIEFQKNFPKSKSSNFDSHVELLTRAKYLIENHLDLILAPDKPDLALIVETLSSKNKEFLYAKRNGVDIRPFSQILGEYLVKENSIVVAGTAGKTTTTALVTLILSNLGLNPSYMIGADVIDLKDSLKLTDSKWSVIEGDEFHSKDISKGAKFLEYKPKFLLLTNIGYEHQDVFPTQEEYIEEFAKLVSLVPEDGIIVAKAGDKNIDKALINVKCKVLRYGDLSDKEISDFYFTYSKNEGFHTEVKIFTKNNSEVVSLNTSMIGKYNYENICAVVTLIVSLPASLLPVELLKLGKGSLKHISDSINSFRGVSKRLEILHQSDQHIVIDDFGVTPQRLKNSLKTLKAEFPAYELVGIYEPNSASRPNNLKELRSMYSDIVPDGVKIYIPTLSSFSSDLALTGDLVLAFQQNQVDSEEIDTSSILDSLYTKYLSKKVLIVFFSSYRLTLEAINLAKRFSKKDS